MPKTHLHYVYALLDGNQQVRYIGVTQDIEKRRIAHRYPESLGTNRPLRQWLLSLSEPPELKVLGVYPSKALGHFAERATIEHLTALGFDLVNLGAGQHPQRKLSPEALQDIYSSSESGAALGRKYNVSREMIRLVRKGHLPARRLLAAVA